MPQSITSTNYQTDIIESEKPVLLEVFSPTCGTCKQMEPIIAELEEEYPRYIFAKINVEEDRDLVEQLGVQSIPTFLFLVDGAIKERHTGYIAKEDLIEKMRKHLG